MIESTLDPDKMFKAYNEGHKLRRHKSKVNLREMNADKDVPGAAVPDPEILSCDPYARSRQLLFCGTIKETQD